MSEDLTAPAQQDLTITTELVLPEGSQTVKLEPGKTYLLIIDPKFVATTACHFFEDIQIDPSINVFLLAGSAFPVKRTLEGLDTIQAWIDEQRVNRLEAGGEDLPVTTERRGV